MKKSALFLLLLATCQLTACTPIERVDYEAVMEETVGLTEEKGFKNISQSISPEGERDYTIFLGNPITRETLPEHVQKIADAFKAAHQETGEKLGSLMIYLAAGDVGDLTLASCRTDCQEEMHVDLTYSDQLGDKLAHFGNAIYDGVTLYGELLSTYEDGTLSALYLIDSEAESFLSFRTGIGDLGYILDSRSGSGDLTAYDSWDDLAEDFPALKLHLDEQGILTKE